MTRLGIEGSKRSSKRYDDVINGRDFTTMWPNTSKHAKNVNVALGIDTKNLSDPPGRL